VTSSHYWLLQCTLMAPKSPAADKDKLIDDDDVLQAVILADSFNKRFKPLTTRKPRVSSHFDQLSIGSYPPTLQVFASNL